MLCALFLFSAVRASLRGSQGDPLALRAERQRADVRADLHQEASGDAPDAMQGLFDAIEARLKAVPSTRPLPECSIHDCSHKISVNIGLTLLKILAVDQKEGTFKIVGWHKLTWTDYRLFYNASELHGFEWDSDKDFIPIEAKDIWKPDVELLNAAAMPENSNTDEPRAFLYDEEKARKDGYNVFLSIPAVFTSKCELDLRSFPFDSQTCDLIFGAWSASTRFMDFGLLQDGVLTNDTSYSLPHTNEEFDVLSVDARTDVFESRRAKAPTSSKEVFPTVVYSVKVQRHPRFYIVNYILPLGTLVVLGASTPWLRVESRAGFQVTLLLSVFAVAYLAAEKLPASPRDTWIEDFQTWCLILSVLPTVESVLLDNVFNSDVERALQPYPSGEFGFPSDAQKKKLIVADAIFRIVYPLLILFGMWWFFLREVEMRGRAYGLLANPLSNILVLLTLSAVFLGVAHLVHVDLPRLK